MSSPPARSKNWRMTSARTPLEDLRTRRRSRRSPGPSFPTKRATVGQSQLVVLTGERVHPLHLSHRGWYRWRLLQVVGERVRDTVEATQRIPR